MGREIKRVPAGFDWPIGKVWSGFVHPEPKLPKRAPRKCPECSGSGLNKRTKQLSDSWYSHMSPTGRGWQYELTQAEVDNLVRENRLWDFWRRFGPNGWEDITPRPRVLAADVNQWARKGFGHDSINQWICVRFRARKLGVYGLCRRCRGEGTIWRRHTDAKRYNRWREFGPPKGDGWQVWETVSEGSPVSPVFRTPEALVDWLCAPASPWDRYSEQGKPRAAAQAFVFGSGWVPSMVVTSGGVYSNIESAAIG